jgi:outer membrane protein assembly factor BamB
MFEIRNSPFRSGVALSQRAGFLLCFFSTLAADQPQWGTAWSRNMVSNERGLPDSFEASTGKNIKWSVKLGSQTHSTPIIAGGRVYIGTNNENPRDPKHKGDRGVFMCLDEKMGALLWQLVVPKRDEDAYMDWPRMGICSDATVEGDRVYLLDNRGAVLCLDGKGFANGNDGPFRDEAAYLTPPSTNSAPRQQVGAETYPEVLRPPTDGKLIQPGPLDADIIWKFDLASQAGTWPHDAAHSSILIHGDYLYINTSTGVDNTHKRVRTPDAPSLVVLDKRTGEFVARDDEHIASNIFHNTWSSPSCVEVNGKALIFFAGGNGILYAFEPFNPSSQRLFYPRHAKKGQETPHESPSAPDSRHFSDQSLLNSSPTTKDGVDTLRKVWQFDFDPAAPKTNVHKYNSNRREGPSNLYGMPVFHNNRIYIGGGGDLWWGKTEAWLKCIDATGTGDITTNGLVWSYPLQKHVLATAAVHNGLVFIADCGRMFHCVDGQTGQPVWTHEVKGDVWASPLVADGKVYLGTRSGTFYIFNASREKKFLSEIELGAPISGTATAANGTLYVATMERLFAIQSIRTR